MPLHFEQYLNVSEGFETSVCPHTAHLCLIADTGSETCAVPTAFPSSCGEPDSFNESLEDITRRELSPAEGISLRHGPYYLSDKKDRWTVSRLKSAAEALQGEEGNAVKSTVRRWLTALHDEPGMAAQMLQRAQMLYGGKQKALLLEATTPVAGRIPAYDMLVVNTINTQVTK